MFPKLKGPLTAAGAVRGLDLDGRVFLITGAYSGLGGAATRALLSAGAKVIIAGRNAQSQRRFADALTSSRSLLRARIRPHQVDGSHLIDLGDLASVRAFAEYVLASYDRVDCLMNNAGIMNSAAGTTVDGFEIQMGTNVIGHFLLAKMLADITSRQVWLSSEGHTLVGTPPGDEAFDRGRAPRIDIDAITQVEPGRYDGWARYQQSKLGNILVAKQFAVQFEHLRTCSVHPGVVVTNLGRHLPLRQQLKWAVSVFTSDEKPVPPPIGARTQTHCAVMSKMQLVNGAYYAKCVPSETAVAAQRTDDAKRLYEYCDEVTRPFQV